MENLNGLCDLFIRIFTRKLKGIKGALIGEEHEEANLFHSHFIVCCVLQMAFTFLCEKIIHFIIISVILFLRYK